MSHYGQIPFTKQNLKKETKLLCYFWFEKAIASLKGTLYKIQVKNHNGIVFIHLNKSVTILKILSLLKTSIVWELFALSRTSAKFVNKSTPVAKNQVILYFPETQNGYFASGRTRRASSEITSVRISVSAGFPIGSDLEYVTLQPPPRSPAQSNCQGSLCTCLRSSTNTPDWLLSFHNSIALVQLYLQSFPW